jgi:hypothetical protein
VLAAAGRALPRTERHPARAALVVAGGVGGVLAMTMLLASPFA